MAALDVSGIARHFGGVRALDGVSLSVEAGERRQLEVAVALATEPRVLLLDEPTAGMSPAETVRITDLVASLPRAITLVIVEHDMDVVFRLADRVTVLHEGRILSEGEPATVRADERVREVYLGREGIA